MGCRPESVGHTATIIRPPPEWLIARILLDSTAVIDALRGRSAADRIRAMRRVSDEPWTCVIVVEEIWRGLREDEERAANRLFRGLRIAPLGVAEGVQAGSWRKQFAQQGITLHQADCLIAAAAVSIGARLGTANIQDFPMTEIAVEHWPSD